jgi:hypothetical protein
MFPIAPHFYPISLLLLQPTYTTQKRGVYNISILRLFKLDFNFIIIIIIIICCDESIKDAHDKRKNKLNLWARSQQLIKLKKLKKKNSTPSIY